MVLLLLGFGLETPTRRLAPSDPGAYEVPDSLLIAGKVLALFRVPDLIEKRGDERHELGVSEALFCRVRAAAFTTAHGGVSPPPQEVAQSIVDDLDAGLFGPS